MTVRTDFKPGEFCWIDLNTHDLDASLDWYGKLFGWSHMMMPAVEGAPPYAFLQKGEAVAAGMGQMSDEMKAQGIPPLWNSYVCSADCAATEAKVKELGGTVTVPSMDVPGHGKLMFLLDPEGASVAVWEPTNKDSPGILVKEAGGLSWNELMSRGTAKAKDFYGKLFGWQFELMPMGDVAYEMIKVDGQDGGGMMPMDGPQFEGIPAHWLVYFDVEDCAATAAKCLASGGKVNVPVTAIPVGEFAVLCDPQGGVFAIITLKQP